jgi:hypothetical protein
VLGHVDQHAAADQRRDVVDAELLQAGERRKVRAALQL